MTSHADADLGHEIEDAAAAAVASWLRKHAAQRHVRDELLSDARLGALKAAQTHDAERSPRRWYLRFRATCEMKDGIRRRSTLGPSTFKAQDLDALLPHQRAPLSLEEISADPGQEDHDLHRVEDWTELVQALEVLSARERLIVVAVDGYGYYLWEVATWLGVSVSAVSQTRSRALAKLRAHATRVG